MTLPIVSKETVDSVLAEMSSTENVFVDSLDKLSKENPWLAQAISVFAVNADRRQVSRSSAVGAGAFLVIKMLEAQQAVDSR
jgi:hypothetical protein